MYVRLPRQTRKWNLHSKNYDPWNQGCQKGETKLRRIVANVVQVLQRALHARAETREQASDANAKFQHRLISDK